MLEAWSDGNVRITSALLGFTSGEMTSWGKMSLFIITSQEMRQCRLSWPISTDKEISFGC